MATPENLAMLNKAKALVGGPLLAILDGLSASEQIDLLVKLCSALACMATAQHRLTNPRTAESFYEEAARAACTVLMDLTEGARQ